MFLSKLISTKSLNEQKLIQHFKNYKKQKSRSSQELNKRLTFSKKNEFFWEHSLYIKSLHLFQTEDKKVIKKYNKFIVSYIFNILVTRNNMFVTVSDFKGKPKFVYSMASFGEKKLINPTIKPAGLIIKMFDTILSDTKHFYKQAVGLHFTNTNMHQESLIVNILKKKFFITLFKSFNFPPHNGCRPKKLRRVKKRRR